MSEADSRAGNTGEAGDLNASRPLTRSEALPRQMRRSQ